MDEHNEENYFRKAVLEAAWAMRKNRIGTTVNLGTPKNPLVFRKTKDGPLVESSTREVLRALRSMRKRDEEAREWGPRMLRCTGGDKVPGTSGVASMKEIARGGNKVTQ